MKLFKKIIYYYEAIKRELNRRPIYEYQCDERLKAKVEGSTRLTYTPCLLSVFGENLGVV